MNKHTASEKGRLPNHRLKEERERRGLSQKDVADYIGLPDTHTVGRWERGETFPRPYYRQKLCEFFGKNAEELGLIKTRPGTDARQTDPTTSESSSIPGYIWNAPSPLDSFVGREQDIAAVCALFHQADVRFVTLLGPGGVGKTRLGIQIARELRKDFANGTCFISLASLSDPLLVLTTIAQGLGMQEGGTQSLIAQLKNMLLDKSLLLFLDNFEQVATAALSIEELLKACPGLKVLATSRAVLHIQAEYNYQVEPLFIPDLAQNPVPEDFMEFSAVALFVRRARALQPTFQLSRSNALDVAQICARLDGLPLGIELAAARIKLLPPKALIKRLPQTLHLLKSDLQGQSHRQQTLFNTIMWSYELLDAEEQWLFRHLSLFPGGCTLGAVEAILGIGRSPDILNTVESLINKSLLRQVEQDTEIPRLVMLETIREFGLGRLQTHEEEEESRRAHAVYYLAFVERAGSYLSGPQQAKWLVQLEQEQENLRAAITWLIQHQETDLALRFCEPFGKFCGLRGYWGEEQHWLSAVLSLPWADTSTAIRARVLRRAGHLAYRLRDLPLARSLLEESVALSRSVEDQKNLAGALVGLGLVLHRQKDATSASCLLRESVEAARESGDNWAIANALENLGRSMHLQGDVAEALQLLEESVALSRALGDKESLARILTTLASIEIALDNIPLAATMAQESYALAQELGTKPLRALVLDSLGEVAMAIGEYDQAVQCFEERISLALELGDTPTVAMQKLHLGEVALAEGDLVKSAAYAQDSLRFFREHGDGPNIAAALGVLGDIKRVQGESKEATALYKEALLLDKEAGHKRGIHRLFIGLAATALEEGQPERAARLFGFEESWTTLPGDLHPAQRLAHEQARESARTQLEKCGLTNAWSEGRLMSIDEALAHALQ